ncbi:MAG: MurR/RpiR family transcriptional regulator [Clostridiaceae bacterium]|nr:MurR/RpiR family transcriptional regulator [Clostridiaceae bacterium]
METYMVRLEKSLSKLSDVQVRVAQYMLDNLEKVVFMTIEDIARETNVSPSTVVRLASALGFHGFTEMLNSLQDIVKERLITPDELVSKYTESAEQTVYDVFNETVEKDISLIRHTLRGITNEKIDTALTILRDASRIAVIGLRSSYASAQFAAHTLNEILGNTTLLSLGYGSLPEEVMKFKNGDVLLAISFPRYSKTTLNVVKLAHENGCKVISITDSILSLLALYSDLVLPCQFRGLIVHNSIVPAISIINAITNSLGYELEKNGKNFRERLKTTDRILKEWDTLIYTKRESE